MINKQGPQSGDLRTSDSPNSTENQEKDFRIQTRSFGLSGHSRQNRPDSGPSAIAAGNDLEAINAWLQGLSTNTFKVYRKCAYRFLRWCLIERSIAFSDVQYLDWLEYEKFLANPPQSWVSQSTPGKFGEDEYRCFRPTKRRVSDSSANPAGLSPRSIAQERRIISGLYKWLVQTRYLVYNPMVVLRKATKTGQYHGISKEEEKVVQGEALRQARASRSHRGKALSAGAWNALIEYVERIPEDAGAGMKRSRLLFLLNFMYYTGVRESEFLNFRTNKDAMSCEVGKDGAVQYVLHIIGKGQRYREIPMSKKVEPYFHAYRRSCGLQAAVDEGESIPLILDLSVSNKKEREQIRLSVGEGSNRFLTEHRVDLIQPMSRQSLYRILTDLYKEVMANTEDELLTRELRNKNVHSIRHTFGSNVVARFGIKTAQDLLGHASTDTTLLYSHLEQEARRKVIDEL